MEGGRYGSSTFNSRESRQMTPRESANASYESTGLGPSYHSKSNFSGGSDGESRHMPRPKRLNSNVPDVLLSMKHHDLQQVRTKDVSPQYSMASMSDHSDMQSFPSDVSYEHLDQHRMAESSSCSQTAVSFFVIIRIKETVHGSTLNNEPLYLQDVEDELKRLKHDMKRITMTYNAVCQESETASVNEDNFVNKH